MKKIQKTNKEWQEVLTPEQYQVTRQKGTEKPFTGQYHNNKQEGVYQCVCCQTPLFTSDTKYDSGTGWPSFWQPISEENVTYKNDFSFFMIRTEILCAICEAHLGHVFNDGPPPTGKRYCLNSAALDFVKKTDIQ